jgi:hypothetical protein
MAIARGAGTEIIRTAHFENIDDTVQYLIIGEQHHIYTILSIITQKNAEESAGNKLSLFLEGYDSKAGDSNEAISICQFAPALYGTFVWNDKFSFNGHEPVDFTGPLSTVAMQNAIADQGSSVSQKLKCNAAEGDDQFELTITYIDQNNA